MCDYKDLNLNRETLSANIQKFLETNGLSLNGQIQVTGNRQRVAFGTAGAEFATVDLHLNKTGTTTIQWKMGKNQSLGEQLALFLKKTIDPAEFETVNFSLKGITTESLDLIIGLLGDSEDLEIIVRQDDDHRKLMTLKSVRHQDQIVITHHKNTLKLQIQGRPLTCYRQLIYHLTDLLDLKGLEQVLCRQDESSAEIVRKEMAEDYLKGFFKRSYDQLPNSVKKLLLSSCCVKLASPQLPDYCLLLYPDLRALEGVLKEHMSGYGMYVSETENGFADFFEPGHKICSLKQEYRERVTHPQMVDAFNEAYSFYRKHRHGLFHMEETPDASRMIDTLQKAIDLAKDAYSAIDRLYTARM